MPFWRSRWECNRDEWALRMRRMGSCPCKQPGRPIARFHSNPSGKGLAGRSALLHRLPIARAIGCALRLASHPGQTLVQLQKDFEQALLHKAEGRRDYPSPRRSYAMAPTGTVLGRPSCVKRLSRATRTCNSTTCRSNVRAITRWPRRLKQCILVSTRLLR